MGSVDFNKIKEAVRVRDEFLLQHPELQPLQSAINKILLIPNKNFYARQIALQVLMLDTWHQIIGVWENKDLCFTNEIPMIANFDNSEDIPIEKGRLLTFPNKK